MKHKAVGCNITDIWFEQLLEQNQLWPPSRRFYFWREVVVLTTNPKWGVNEKHFEGSVKPVARSPLTNLLICKGGDSRQHLNTAWYTQKVRFIASRHVQVKEHALLTSHDVNLLIYNFSFASFQLTIVSFSGDFPQAAFLLSHREAINL